MKMNNILWLALLAVALLLIVVLHPAINASVLLRDARGREQDLRAEAGPIPSIARLSDRIASSAMDKASKSPTLPRKSNNWRRQLRRSVDWLSACPSTTKYANEILRLPTSKSGVNNNFG
jgi:hypothetical protein